MPTCIADVVLPSEFSAYTVENSMQSLAFYQSGVLVRNGEMESQLSAGAESFTVPFWADLSDIEADITSDDPEVLSTPQKQHDSIHTGDAGAGKSTLATWIAHAIAEGFRFMGFEVKTLRSVLYLDRENSLPVVKERLTRLQIRPEPRFKYFGAQSLAKYRSLDTPTSWNGSSNPPPQAPRNPARATTCMLRHRIRTAPCSAWPKAVEFVILRGQRLSFMKQLVIISSPGGATEDERLSALATFLGVSNEILPFERDRCSAHELLNQVRPGLCGLAMHIETLRQVHRALSPGTTLQQLLDDRFSEILVYGVSAAAETNDALKALTDGAIHALTMHSIQTVRYSIPHETRGLCAQLAGQSFSTNNEHSACTLEIRSGCGLVETIVAANDHPMFVRFRTETRDLFLLASRMPELSKPLSWNISLGDDCIPLLPPLIFLRHCFPESCWHGGEATARLIIDDPLLTKNYGALDFGTLKTSMQRLGYGTSIAFIPWNHWRSSRRSAARLLNADSNLSICVHGCDHTNHEFQSGSASVLAQRASLGIQRMEKHRNRVGVPFEDVMVFPQGQFSKAAIPGLRSANYLAAVNSTCFPTDYEPDDLRIADFLMPAVTRYDGFPIFNRRYPRSTFEFALDLFLGKPAILVEHHEYFRDRCKGIEGFVAALQRIEPNLSWPGLSEQLMRSNMRRRSDDGSIEMQFFTRRFRFTPKEAEDGRYRLAKFEPNPDTVERVLVDAKSVSFGFEKGNLVLEVQAVPGQLGNIEIIDRATPSAPIHSFGTAHNARVLLRRGLSEFRDGTLSRHKGLMKVAKRLAKTMKTTGDA